MKTLKIIFYVEYPYYFPHFLPISNVLKNAGHEVNYVLSTKQNNDLSLEIAQKYQLNYFLGVEHLFSLESDYIFFANIFDRLEECKTKSIFMDHGVGTKSCDYKTALTLYNLVLVEGDYRFDTLNREFPDYRDKIKKVGFSKLDAVFNFSEEEKTFYINKYKIDKNKTTILYAPTFFPSSIEKMSPSFPEDFKDCNIIIKAHYLSLHRKRYKKQQAMFKKWEKYENCSICEASEYSLVPFLNLCDIMISDESSAIFEFTALNKPVILNRFLKLRWSYHLFPHKLLKRLDANIHIYRKIGDNAQSYTEMCLMLRENIKNPHKYQKIRKEFSHDICGILDGKTSERILTLLEENNGR